MTTLPAPRPIAGVHERTVPMLRLVPPEVKEPMPKPMVGQTWTRDGYDRLVTAITSTHVVWQRPGSVAQEFETRHDRWALWSASAEITKRKARNILPPPPAPPALPPEPPPAPPWQSEPGHSAHRPIRMEDIVTVVCGFIPEIQVVDICGRGRHYKTVFAREMIVAAARACTCRSYPEIARAIGRPNHSSVITAHQRVNRRIRDGQKVDDRIMVDTTYEQVVGEIVELVRMTRRKW